MALRIPKKIAKKSLTRDSSGGNPKSSAAPSIYLTSISGGGDNGMGGLVEDGSLVAGGSGGVDGYGGRGIGGHFGGIARGGANSQNSFELENDDEVDGGGAGGIGSKIEASSVTKKAFSRGGKFANVAADTMKKMHPISSATHSSHSNHNQEGGSNFSSEFGSPGGGGGGISGGSKVGGGGMSGAGGSNSNNPFENSEGTMRLNRILDQRSFKNDSLSGGAARHGGRSGVVSSGRVNGVGVGMSSMGDRNHSRLEELEGPISANAMEGSSGGGGVANTLNSSPLSLSQRRSLVVNSFNSNNVDYIPPSKVQLADPTDEHAVGEMTCRISSKQRVDSRSIGGTIVAGDGKVEARTGNVLLREGWEEQLVEETAASNPAAVAGEGETGGGAEDKKRFRTSRPINRLTNECLLSMCVSQFDLSIGISGGPSGGKKRHIPIAKTRNKLRYIVILRSTNRPLVRPRSLGKTGVDGRDGGAGSGLGADDDDGENDDEEDLGSDDGYDHMYNPDPSEGDSTLGKNTSVSSKKKNTLTAHKKNVNDYGEDGDTEDGSSQGFIGARDDIGGGSRKTTSKLYEEYDCGIPPEREISSFPALLCLAIHADGTKPDIRKVLELEKLVSIENAPPRKNDAPGSAGFVILVFRNGDAVEIDCDLPNAVMHATGAGAVGGAGGAGAIVGVAGVGKKNIGMDATNRLRKERFLWSLLQIHAILCTAVVERTAAAAALARPGGVVATNQLPPLVVRNVDRGELQYISTVNGFLTESPILCALLDRQRNRGRGLLTSGGAYGEEKKSDDHAENGKSDEMDGMAYDMMMGYYNRVALFANDEEKRDAADVLNSTVWQQQEFTSDGMTNVDASATAETLMRLLQQRMRDLEAETCRRLISWEDEKYFSALGMRLEGNSTGQGKVNTVDAMSLNDLFKTLQHLDDELEKMESWIHERANMIRPITDECRGIEEENRMLEQQWVSYEMLGIELKRLLGGLVLPTSLTKVLENPGSVIVYDRSGAVDVDRSEEGVELIHQAGQALKLAIDTAENEGGIHLRAVSDTVKVLSATCNKFCRSLAQIVVTVMEQLAKEVCARPDATIGKVDTHSSIAKKIREVRFDFFTLFLSIFTSSHCKSHTEQIHTCFQILDPTAISGLSPVLHQDNRDFGTP